MMRLLYLIAAALFGSIVTALYFNSHQFSEPVVNVVTVYDTIPYPYPVPVDSIIIRYQTETLPKATVPHDTVLIVDSVAVSVPIVQKEYQDSTYHVWISGFAPNLDSIHTYSRHDYVSVPPPPVKPKRWHLGMSAGAALTPQGIQPYIGVGITYSFKSF